MRKSSKIWNGVRKIFFASFVFIFVFMAACEAGENLDMKITSPEFENNAFIPERFTCQGEGISPMLMIEGVPEGTKTLALIVDDPDAPMGTWVHWVVYNIPIVSVIEEDSVPGQEAMNDFSRESYGGPCPPSGIHRYFFKLYALDTELSLRQGIRKKDLEKAMQGHILAQAELIGLYKKH